MNSQILIGVFIASFALQMMFYLHFFLKLVLFRQAVNKDNQTFPLSVIISAKNEAENLKAFLPLVLEQKYPDFELIVINDNSADASAEVLADFAASYKHLVCLDADTRNEGGNKKAALSKAVAAAKNEVLIFTDADCRPASPFWLQKIANSYSEDTEIVLAYGGYEAKKGFLNKLIRFETLFNAMQYMSFALVGLAYMGVGRNLSYKKSLFKQQKGFSRHQHVLSGDDDLFVNKAANKTNVKINIDARAKTIAVPEATFKAYLKQKKRHLSAGFMYRQIHLFLLGLEVFSRFLFYLSALFLLSSANFVLPTVLLYAFRLFLLLFLLNRFSDRMKEQRNSVFIFIFDFLVPLINLVVSIQYIFNRKIAWKQP